VNLIYGSTVNIEEFKGREINIDPNSTTGILKIESDEPIETIKIYTDDGKEIEVLDKSKIDFHVLPTGIYHVEINTKTRSITQQIIKKSCVFCEAFNYTKYVYSKI